MAPGSIVSFVLLCSSSWPSSGASRRACPAGGNEGAGSSRSLDLHRANGPVKRMFEKNVFSEDNLNVFLVKLTTYVMAYLKEIDLLSLTDYKLFITFPD